MKKRDNPFFTIVLPIYNVEKYLERCVESILKQDFKDFELLLIDDGSPDRCPEICDYWANLDNRIKVIHKSNGGLGLARNTGIENATGKYIFFIDSDDYIMQSLFSDIYNVISRNDKIDMISYGFKRINSNGETLSNLIPNTPKKYYDSKNEIQNIILPYFIAKSPHDGSNYNIRVSAWNCCIRLDIIKKNKLKFVSEREYISEDLYFYLELFKKIENIQFIEKDYYCYCQNEGSLTFSYKKDRFFRIKKFYIDAIELANKNDYNGEVQLRLYASFYANVIGCLKMEVANIKKTGYSNTYKKLIQICNDEFLCYAINLYPDTYFSKNWKIITKLIKNKKILILIIWLLIQFKIKGI